MESLQQDLRFAVRMLLKNPAFATIAVVCIALGIGVHTTIFTVVNAVLLRPLPYKDPGSIVVLHSTQPKNDIESEGVSYLDLQDYREQATAFSEVAAYTGRSLTLASPGSGSEPERVWSQRVTANLFPMLGVKPALGRQFRPDEERAGAPGAILLSHSLWLRRFNGDPKILNQVITVNLQPHTVVGVMPPGFRFADSKEEAWIPLQQLADDYDRSERSLIVLGRLRPGIAIEPAISEVKAIAARLAKAYPVTHSGWEANLYTLRREFVGKEMKLIILTMLGAVTCVLLIACSNVANLLLARGTGRQREIALRAAFGASRFRLIRQLLVESVLLALAGGGLGVLLSVWGVRWIELSIPVENAPPPWMHFTIDRNVLLATLATAIGTGLLFGLAPALQSTRTDLNHTLKEGGRGTSGSLRGHLFRNGLVVLQITLSLILLVVASLFVRSFLKVQEANPGFDTARVLTFRIYLPGESYADPMAKTRRVEDIVRRLEALPGVAAATASNLIPFDGGGGGGQVLVDGRAFPEGEEPRIFQAAVTPHFLQALGVQPVAGRNFTQTEGEAKSPVAVVNQAFADKLFPEGGALGSRFRMKGDEDSRWLTVIGVVANLQTDNSKEEEIQPAAYVPYPWIATANTGFTVRTRIAPGQVAPLARREVHASDPNLPVFGVSTLEEVRLRSFWEYGLFSSMFSAFGVIALVLASVGVYGVLSYGVSQRLHELGVRVALGARKSQVLRLVVQQGMRLTFLGVVLGLLGAFASTRILQEILYDVSASDPLSFAGIPILLAGVAFFASYVPARRATEVDPLAALRGE